MSKPKKILIVGGGISGLSAAYYTQKYFREKGIPVEITLVEKSDRFGGKINTLHRDGFVIERGPDSFLTRKTPTIELSKELGLEDELRATNPKAKKTYILHNGQLHRMPPGLVMGIPTQFMPFMKTGLLSPLGKIRAAMDMILPRGTENDDESLGHFLERRLGSEVLRQIAEPLLAGIYAGDTYALSLKATFPQFQAAEQKHRSLILGMLANKAKTPAEIKLAEPLKSSMFLTYQQGLHTLVQRLLDSLEQVTLCAHRDVTNINFQQNRYQVSYDNGLQDEADALILATPPFATAKLLGKLPSTKMLTTISYVSVANVIMAFDVQDIKHPFDGSGFLVPRKEKRHITACTWTSAKWPHSTPEGKVLLRCYLGRSGEEEKAMLPDDEMLAKVRQDLRDIIGLTAEPLFHEITRLPHSMPQYPVGHSAHMKQIRQDLQRTMPGIFIAGAGYDGIGIPDCIKSGKVAAEQVDSFISS